MAVEEIKDHLPSYGLHYTEKLADFTEEFNSRVAKYPGNLMEV